MKRKFVIRVYTPKDPFHKRSSFWEKDADGEEFLQYALGNWAIMLAWIYTEGRPPIPMPFFMWVADPD